MLVCNVGVQLYQSSATSLVGSLHGTEYFQAFENALTLHTEHCSLLAAKQGKCLQIGPLAVQSLASFLFGLSYNFSECYLPQSPLRHLSSVHTFMCSCCPACTDYAVAPVYSWPWNDSMGIQTLVGSVQSSLLSCLCCFKNTCCFFVVCSPIRQFNDLKVSRLCTNTVVHAHCGYLYLTDAQVLQMQLL